jgi:hypothetical protein
MLWFITGDGNEDKKNIILSANVADRCIKCYHRL